MNRREMFCMYLAGLRGMSLHPGAGQRGHVQRTLKQDRDEACDMVIETERLAATGFFDKPEINVPPE